MLGSGRYVIVAPGDNNTELQVNRGSAEDLNAKASFVDVAKICMLIVPFNIAYSQCPTTFMVQGSVMKPFLGFIEAPNLDIRFSIGPCSWLFCQYLLLSVPGK
jgi:hypothetical protein